MEIQDILGYLLGTSARFIKRRMDQYLSKYNLTTSQWAVIKLLSSKDGLTQAEIADGLKGDRATAGSIILNLQQKGYVEKLVGKEDRRSYVISLTEKAGKAVKEINIIAERVTKEALLGVSDENAIILNDALKQIIRNLSKEVTSDDMETGDI